MAAQPRTHLAIDSRLCGKPIELGDGRAAVAWSAPADAAADERGLVHGGFVFGVADYAAMLAVGDPLVVLASAEVRFLRPVRVGERLVATASVAADDGKKRRVEVTVARDGEEIFSGTFLAVVPSRHVLDR